MGAIGILLVAAHNGGFVVLTSEPVELMASGHLVPVSYAFGPALGFRLTEKGRSEIVKSAKSRQSKIGPLVGAEWEKR